MGESRYVLLVDDDQDDRYLFSEALNSLNHKFNLYEAKSASDGLYQLKTNAPPPDVIFLDLNMPQLNGFDFLADIKASERANIPVVIYSTSNAAEDKRRTSEMGAVHFMTKHNSFSALCSELSLVLSSTLQ